MEKHSTFFLVETKKNCTSGSMVVEVWVCTSYFEPNHSFCVFVLAAKEIISNKNCSNSRSRSEYMINPKKKKKTLYFILYRFGRKCSNIWDCIILKHSNYDDSTLKLPLTQFFSATRNIRWVSNRLSVVIVAVDFFSTWAWQTCVNRKYIPSYK